MRMLNKPEVVTEVVKQPTKTVKQLPKGPTHWYRVAIMYNADQDFYYTKVIDKPHHHTMVEGELNFVRWEPAVEYVV